MGDVTTWRRLTAIYALLAGAVVIYAPSAVTLHRLWTDTQGRAYTHGYLIALISLGLIARARGELARLPARPALWALPVLVLLSALWLVCWRARLQDLHLILLPVLAGLSVLAALGPAVTRVLLFPLGFLYFAFPLWADLNAVLLAGTVAAERFLIWATGLPALLVGNVVHLPYGALEIAVGCNGLHFFMVGLAVAALNGELARDPPRRRLVWMALMGALSVLGNWIRVFVIVAQAYFTDMRGYLVAVDHYRFGWLVFAALVVLFFWITSRVPIGKTIASRPQVALRSRAVPWAVPVALACAAVLPVWGYAIELRSLDRPLGLQIQWPVASGWSAAPAGSSWQPIYPNATVSGLHRYSNPVQGDIELYCVAYRVQQQSGKLIGYNDSLLGEDATLRQVADGVIQAPDGLWRELQVGEEGHVTALIWARYWIGAHSFVRPWQSQIWYGLTWPAAPPISSLVAVRARCQPDCAAARARLTQFTSSLSPRAQLVAANTEVYR
jgi:exosortase